MIEGLCVLGWIMGLIVISSTNAIYSVFGLIGLFVNITIMLLLLGIDFLGLVILVVYVGAITILFLFVIMMLNLNMSMLKEDASRYIGIGVLSGFLILINVFIFAPSTFELLNEPLTNQMVIYNTILYWCSK